MPPVLLSKVFSRFSGQPEAWSGARIARIISSLFSDRMISCVVNGNVSLAAPFQRLSGDARSMGSDSSHSAKTSDIRRNGGCCPTPVKRYSAWIARWIRMHLIHLLGECLKQWKTSLAVFGRLAETGQVSGSGGYPCLSFIYPGMAGRYRIRMKKSVLSATGKQLWCYFPIHLSD